MCDRSPGVRCSDYATSTLKITKNRLEKIRNEKASYEEKYAESLANTENPSPRDTIRQNKYKRLVESEKEHQKIVDGAEFEYHSCPVGQAELRADLEKAKESGDTALQEELEARIQAGEAYRAQNRENLRDLEAIEKEQGPEAAAEEGWQRYEKAVEAETEAIILGEQSRAELEAARAEAEEYRRALEESVREGRLLSPEEEEELNRKHYKKLLLISALASAVIVFSLIRHVAGGQKSQLLSYGKSMFMRQAMAKGPQFLAAVAAAKRGENPAEARNQAVYEEAEKRAAAARERVLLQHEHEKAEAERKQLRDEARLEELAFRNTMREQEREAERERRREELAHYQALAEQFKNVPLTPEMQALIDSKKPKGFRPQYGNNGGSRQDVAGANSGNNGGRQYSTRRQGQPDLAKV